MLGQLHEALKILKIEGHEQHCLVVKVTNECHLKCEHCYEESDEAVVDGGIDLALVERATKGLVNWLMCLQGGEPMRYPEKCRDIVEIGRKNNMMTMLVTSGFWLNTPSLVDYVIETIRPTYLTFSVNEWTAKHVPIAHINAIAGRLKDNPNITMFASSVYGNSPDMTVEDNDFVRMAKGQKEIEAELTHRFFRTPVPLIDRGRGGALSNRVPRFKIDGEVKCNCGGITLDVDGSLYANCPNVKFGCRFGRLDDHKNLNALADSINKPKWKVNAVTFGAAEICRKAKSHCLDQKWKNPAYIETVIL
jgi:hypothetical protein